MANKVGKINASITDEEFIKVCKDSVSMLAAAKQLGLALTTFRRRAKSLNCYNTNQGGKAHVKNGRMVFHLKILNIKLIGLKHVYSKRVLSKISVKFVVGIKNQTVQNILHVNYTILMEIILIIY